MSLSADVVVQACIISWFRCISVILHQDELEKHVNEHVQLQVFTYYGQSRTSNVKQLAENDIVLTTYQTLASDSKVCLSTVTLQCCWYACYH